MAMEMADEPEARELRGRVQFTFSSMIDHWTTPVRDTYPGYRQAFTSGLEVGDLTYASLSREMEVLALLLTGEPLDEVRAEMADARAWMVQHQQHQTLAMVDLFQQVAENLQGEGNSVVELAGPTWSASDREAELVAGDDRTAMAARDVGELWLAVLAGDRDRATVVDHRLTETDALEALEGTVWVPLYHFLSGLVALWPGHRPNRRAARRHRKKLRRWATHTPESTSHRVLALEAGLVRGPRRGQRAIERYEAAASAASESGAFLGDLGLICERAALVCEEVGLTTAADAWRRRADRAYVRWGATVKAPPESHVDGDAADQTLDMHALLRLSQAVGGELHLEDLLRRVLTIALEVSGARSGHLITPVDGNLIVMARGHHGEEIEVLARTPIDEAGELPVAIVNYVARRREPVILDDATHKGPFVLDPDVRARQLRSVLCAPLMTQGQLVSIVYLENDLVEGAFKPERLDALSLLSTSASSAIANATLVAHLEELNVAYERFVPADFLRLLGKANIVDVSLGDGVERDITVLFTDIRGFTPLSEALTPSEAFRLVNDYLEMAVPIIEQHGGVVDKYIGDAILSLFPDDPGSAVRASLHLLGEVDAFNEEREARGEPRLETGVGLHTGRLMLGTVGTARRMDGTVIGDAVNLGSRVEGLTKVYGARLLVTEATWNALDPLERPRARLVDRVLAAGTTRPISLYHVLTPVEVEAIYTLDDFEAGGAAYFRADFAAAERHLLEVLRRHPDDLASRLLLGRCRELSQNGVPPDWDGVTAYTVK
jgi:class 3 adenylate cyclase